MATLEQVLDALADQIRDVLDGASDVTVSVEAGMVPTMTPPSVEVFPTPGESIDQELAAFGDRIGGDLLTIRARVSLTDVKGGQRLLWALMDDVGPLSLTAALDEDPTVGGRVQTLDVRTRSGYELVEDPGGEGALLSYQLGLVVVKAHS